MADEIPAREFKVNELSTLKIRTVVFQIKRVFARTLSFFPSFDTFCDQGKCSFVTLRLINNRLVSQFNPVLSAPFSPHCDSSP